MTHGIQKADVCIICALEEEADAVEQVTCEQCKVAFTTRMTSDDRFVYRSTTITNTRQEPLTLVLLSQTRPGPVSAALDAGTLLQVFRPSFVGMSGICAGDKRHLHLGDLVVAEYAYHFEEGKVTRDEIGTVVHQPEGITYGPAEPLLQYVRAFGTWKTSVAELKKRFFLTSEPPRCVLTLMASGMAVHSDDPFDVLQRQHRKTWALDMEAASFYHAMRAFPAVDSLVVKGVCDYADLCKDDTFHDFAARASAMYLLTFIREYVTMNTFRRKQSRPLLPVSIMSSYKSDWRPDTRRYSDKIFSTTPEQLERFWRNTPDTLAFYGREQELILLTQWIMQDHCRIVSVLGIGGIGKSALATSITQHLEEQFEMTILLSLRDAPPCEVLLDKCLQKLSPQELRKTSATLEQRISLLLEHLQNVRTLIVLDNLESVLEEKDVRGHFRPGFLGYRQLLHRVAETTHQSCLLITSREKPTELRRMEGKNTPVRSLRLKGLDTPSCQKLFEEKELIGTETEQAELIEVYEGNPLALKIVAETILDLFGGAIGSFLTGNAIVFGSITDLLDEQFMRLSALEQSVFCWLAILREPVTLDELQTLLVTPLPRVQMLEAIDACYRRSLIERGKSPGSFTLQSVVLEYVTAFLITETSREIKQHRLHRLIEYGLSLATAKEYVRQTQERLLVTPLLANLQRAYQGRAKIEEQLCSLLDQLRNEDDDTQGYGPSNLITLLRLLRGDLSGLNLSHLFMRRAYLQGVEMHETSLAFAKMSGTVFTEASGAIWGVTTSPDGKWWVAGNERGEVRMWDEGDLQRIWQAHTDIIPTLAFSPNGRTLASGSWDGTIKLWDVASGALLCTGRQANMVYRVAFSPDGRMVASASNNASVRIWNPQDGTTLQIISHSGTVFEIAWSPDGRHLATGDFAGCIRLWQIEMPPACVQTLSGHTNWIMGLAFSPNGQTLASGSWDGTTKLWNVTSGCMLQTLSGHADRVHGVSWSRDGLLLASCSVDRTIRFWDIEQGICRAVLRGHTSAVYDLCFTPDGSHLLSGSADGTLHVWEVESRQCAQVIQGYATSFSDIDWSPDGTQLMSGGTDGVVTIWDAIGDVLPRVLYGHSWIVWGVGWSRDGRFLASSEHAAIHVWDPISGACLQKLQDPVVSSLVVAWRPDGQQLACGTLMHGVQVLDLTTGHLRWPVCTHPAAIRYANWSPDGTRLTAGSDEGTVYLWDAMDGTLQRQLQGHHGVVMRVVWSPDGRLLASCGGSSGNGELFVWDGKMGERIQTFLGHPGTVHAVAWGPSNDLLVSGGSDGTLRKWDVKTGKCLERLQAHQGVIRSLKVSPNGTQLASCSDDGAIRIWDLESFDHLRTLQRDRPYERLNITGVRGLTEAKIAMLHALGAIEVTV